MISLLLHVTLQFQFLPKKIGIAHCKGFSQRTSVCPGFIPRNPARSGCTVWLWTVYSRSFHSVSVLGQGGSIACIVHNLLDWLGEEWTFLPWFVPLLSVLGMPLRRDNFACSGEGFQQTTIHLAWVFNRV